MVLVIDGVMQDEYPPDSRTLFINHPSFKETNNQFLSIPTKVIGPAYLLYVEQREMAVTASYDSEYSVNAVLVEGRGSKGQESRVLLEYLELAGMILWRIIISVNRSRQCPRG